MNLYNKWLPPICSSIVLILNTPSLYKLFRNSSISNLNLAIQQSILLFYIFGYRTHDKTIIWYIVALQLSTFEFSVQFQSIMNLMTIFTLQPMVVEYGKEFVATFYFFLNVCTHYLLVQLPQLQPNQNTSAALSLISKIPGVLKYLTPLCQLYVGYCTVQFYRDPQPLKQQILLVE